VTNRTVEAHDADPAPGDRSVSAFTKFFGVKFCQVKSEIMSL